MSEETKWINSKEQIATATEAELRRVLLTCDGNGVEFKTLALEKLLEKRSKNETAKI